MTIVGFLKKALEKPTVTGTLALGWAIAAVVVPTAFRLLFDHAITGVAFSPYLPFVLFAAIFLGPRHAAAIAAASAIVADLLFIDPRFVPLAGPTDLFGMAVFLATAALVIMLVQTARHIVEACVKPAPCGENQTGIIFSLERGQAWATWAGCQKPLRLGPQGEVTDMMQDFLAQIEVGNRLGGKHR